VGPNRRAQERERAAARAAAKAKRAEAERNAIAEAEKIVAIWNARQAGGRALWFYPTIGAAIAAGVPWLSFSCPACGQFGSVDLRTLDRHPGASISSLIPSVSCRRCSPCTLRSRDARVLADALRTDRAALRRLAIDDPVVIELREWSRMADELTQERTRLTNQIHHQLWRYYPQALQLSDDLAADWFLDLWRQSPDPGQSGPDQREDGRPDSQNPSGPPH
jgi:hypothetical protein